MLGITWARSLLGAAAEVHVPIGYQLILRRVDDAVLAPSTAARRAFACCVARVARGWPVPAFHAPDGHAHVQVFCDREAAGRLARALGVSIARVLGHAGALEPARLRPVHDQGHARHLFRYVLDQQRHHGVVPDPCHEASALPDLLGLRACGAWLRQVVADRLPRVRRGLLVELLGVDPDDLREVRLDLLAEATAAAVGRAEVGGRAQDLVLARAAGVALARPHFAGRAVAEALGLTPRTVQRLAALEVPRALAAAVQGQWRLRTWLADPD